MPFLHPLKYNKRPRLSKKTGFVSNLEPTFGSVFLLPDYHVL